MAVTEVNTPSAFMNQVGLGAGEGNASDGDTVRVTAASIAATGPWMPPDGVKVTAILSDGSIPSVGPAITGGALDNSSKAGTSHPSRVQVENLDLTQKVEFYDPDRVVLLNLLIHGTGANELIRFRPYDNDNSTARMIGCDVYDNTNDGVDLTYAAGGTASDASRTVISVEKCNVYDCGTAGQPDQAVTPHNGGMFIIDGGYYTSRGTKAIGPSTASSHMIVRRARIVGKMDAHIIEDCVWDGGALTSVLFASTAFKSSIQRNTITNVGNITVQGSADIKRNDIRQSSSNVALFKFNFVNGVYVIESNMLLGNQGASNRCVQGVGGTGQSLTMRNNNVFQFGIVNDTSSTNFATADWYHCLIVGCLKLVQTVGPLDGRWNYLDGSWTDAANWGSFNEPDLNVAPIPHGYARGDFSQHGTLTGGPVGAAAFPMVDYANGDFRPDLTEVAGQTFHKVADWGDASFGQMATHDIDGNPFVLPTAGCYGMASQFTKQASRGRRR